MGISYVQFFLQVVLVPEDHAGTRKGDGRAGSHISYFATISLTPTRGGETSRVSRREVTVPERLSGVTLSSKFQCSRGCALRPLRISRAGDVCREA